MTLLIMQFLHLDFSTLYSRIPWVYDFFFMWKTKFQILIFKSLCFLDSYKTDHCGPEGARYIQNLMSEFNFV